MSEEEKNLLSEQITTHLGVCINEFSDFLPFIRLITERKIIDRKQAEELLGICKNPECRALLLTLTEDLGRDDLNSRYTP
jgi:hypothetical protein